MLSIHAPAKLNLFLHLTGKRADGYHTLLTQVVFTEFGDRLVLEPSDLLTLSMQGEFSAGCQGDDNLVLRAARLLQQETGMHMGARMTLHKHIPVGAGLGGGSADAAAALRGLNALWQLGLTREELAGLGEQLGADVPMCVYSEPLFASGVGAEIALYDSAAHERISLHLVLVYPRITLLTAQVFALVTEEEVERGIFALSHGYGAPLAQTRNDLQRAAIAASPIVGEVLLAMETMPGNKLLVRMTGSGACCFAVFKEAQEAAAYAALLAQDYPDWWIKHTTATL